MLIARATCPTCGAPLDLRDGQRRVLCAYCNASLVVAGATATAAAPAALTPDQVPREVVERVKQCALDGKRDEAITAFASASGASRDEATEAVDRLLLPELARLLRQAPINAFGFALTFVPLAVLGATGAWSVGEALAGGHGWALLALLCAVLAVERIRWFVPKAISAAVLAFGATGRARVLRRTILRPRFVQDASIALVLFQVQPHRGGEAFIDEEVLLLRETSIARLEPGNIIEVRYDEPRRQRVFPVSPIVVVGRA